MRTGVMTLMVLTLTGCVADEGGPMDYMDPHGDAGMGQADVGSWDAMVAADGGPREDLSMSDRDLGVIEPPLEGAGEDLRFNSLQLRGSDNSYHLTPVGGEGLEQVAYDHRPLDEQLREQGIRHIDLDAARGNVDPIEVFVGREYIYSRSLCTALEECLQQLGEWSDEHPEHTPVVVSIGPDSTDTLDPFLRDVEVLIEERIGRRRVFAPRDLRGQHATLSDALAADGWPTLAELRGRFIFVLTARGQTRALYREGGGTLTPDTERLMFTLGDSLEDAEGIFFEYAEITAEQVDEVHALVAARRVVRTFVDDADNFDRAMEVGAHFLSTRFPDENLPREALEGWPIACNPATAPDDCEADWFGGQ